MTVTNDVILDYTYNGSNRYSITFEYDHPEQVLVRTYNGSTNQYDYITEFEFDGPTVLVFTGTVPASFQIIRSTNITNSFGAIAPNPYVSILRSASAIKATEVNGNFELLRQAIEENASGIGNSQDQINDINIEIDRLDDRIDQEIIDRENGDQNLQNQIDAIEGGSLDGRYVNVTGDTMTGALSMSLNKITNLSTPTNNKDAVNLETLVAYIRDLTDQLNSLLDDRYVNVIGDSMTGILEMGTNQIKLVQDPTAPLDAVNLRTLREYLGISPDDPDRDFYSFQRVDLVANDADLSSIDTTLTLVGNHEYVYLNGKLLDPDADYAVNSDNTTIDFEQDLFSGDLITVINFSASTVTSRETIATTTGEVRYSTSLQVDNTDLNITINGVLLLPNDRDYGMVVPDSFLLTTPTQPGDVLRVYQLDFTRTTILATEDELITFNVAQANQFTAGEELVFMNGILINPTTDYTVTDGGLSITLERPAQVGDIILILTNT